MDVLDTNASQDVAAKYGEILLRDQMIPGTKKGWVLVLRSKMVTICVPGQLSIFGEKGLRYQDGDAYGPRARLADSGRRMRVEIFPPSAAT